jgi:hypothetical protein
MQNSRTIWKKFRLLGRKTIGWNNEMFKIFSSPVQIPTTANNKLHNYNTFHIYYEVIVPFTFVIYTNCFLAFKKPNIHDHIIEGVSYWFRSWISTNWWYRKDCKWSDNSSSQSGVAVHEQTLDITQTCTSSADYKW